MTSPNASHCRKQVVRPIRGHVWHSPLTLNLANTDCPGRLIPKILATRNLQNLPVILATKNLLLYFAHIVQDKFAHLHLLIIPTDPTCHHNSFWGSRCDSNHAPSISLKPCISFVAISAIPLTHNTFHGVSHHL